MEQKFKKGDKIVRKPSEVFLDGTFNEGEVLIVVGAEPGSVLVRRQNELLTLGYFSEAPERNYWSDVNFEKVGE